MHTLLLLAGRSKRFWPLTEKSLWPFFGKPLLLHQVERLQEGGLTDITFVGGAHNLQEVQDLIPNVQVIEQEDLELGMRGALLSALPTLSDRPVCIVSGNDVIDPAGYKALKQASEKNSVDGAILAQRVSEYFPGGYLVTEGDRVTSIMEKPGEGNEPSDLVNIVAHIHNNPQKLFEVLQQASSENDDVYEVALTSLCQELHYTAVPFKGAWNAIKYPWHILDLMEELLSGLKKKQIAKSAEIHSSAVIEGAVVIEEGVRVLPHATIQGPAFIGRNSIIGTNALVRDSMIGGGCVIGYSSEIARSHLHSHIWTHSTYLGDTVVGCNAAFGAGTTAANFRLDEGEISSVVKGEKINTKRKKLGAVIGDHVRCGVQTVFAPGVKVGSGSFINSAVSLTEDVQERRFVTVKEGVLEERDNRHDPPGIRGE